MNWLNEVIRIVLILNTLLAVYIVFHRKRAVGTTWAWLIVLLTFPVIGLILYGFLGRGLSQENLFAINRQSHIGLKNVQKMIQKAPKKRGLNDTSTQAQTLITYFNSRHDAPLSKDNQPQIFIDGKAKFKQLFADISQAHDTINVEYYSFMNDHIGNAFLNLLVKKASQGIKVRLIYDPWGSPGASKAWFRPLTDLGGDVIPFITAHNMIKKYRVNYHLHRKIVVIDGRISWTGGFNVGDQYLGTKKKFGYWRDTHVRLVGSASLLLQERFVMDWNASITKKEDMVRFDTHLFPSPVDIAPTQANVATQIVSDGPDTDEAFMRNGLSRMEMMAKKTLWIQTPYLIPDEPMIATWLTAVRSGVDVRIMVPCMPDHPFIYRATQWYANELTQAGIKIYIYQNGFLHAKTVAVDDHFSTIGSMNQDYRSYLLNFETNAFFYDRTVTNDLKTIFLADMKDCTLLTPEMIRQQSLWLRTLQRFSRMLSPIL